MLSLIFNLFFLFVSIAILIRAISYAIYEIKQENNKSGGITVIAFSVVVVIFANIMVWIR